MTLGAWLIRLLLAALGATWRWRVRRGGELLEDLRASRRATIFVYWHNQTLIFARFFSRRFMAGGFPMALLSSWSKDGELGARLAAAWGGTVIRGSASRGGTQGLRGLFRHLRKGGSCVLAPDGPRGPLYQPKPGAAVLSRMARTPILPVAARVDRVWRLRSWDRLQIPKPFARIEVIVGEPWTVPLEADLTTESVRLGERLSELGGTGIATT